MPQTASPPKRHPVSQPVFDLYLQLQARWPTLFNLSQPKPLRIGMDQVILAEMPEVEALLQPLMRWYVTRRAYLEAMLKGTHRYGLDGEPVCELSELDRQSARARLNGLVHRGRFPRQGAQSKPGPVGSPEQQVKPQQVWQEMMSQKGALPMTTEINATVKLTLREAPEMRESQDGSTLYCALRNVPKGLPGGAELPEAPLYLAIPKTMWGKAQHRAREIEATSQPVLWLIEGAVGIGGEGLLVYAKGIQTVAGKVKGA